MIIFLSTALCYLIIFALIRSRNKNLPSQDIKDISLDMTLKTETDSNGQVRLKTQNRFIDDRYEYVLALGNNAEPVAINYQKDNGQRSERRPISPKMIVGTKRLAPCYLVAICYKSSEMRTFKLDRISEVVHLETGEVYKDGNEYADYFCQKHPITDDLLKSLGA